MPPVISPTTAQVTLVYTGPVFDSGGGATVLGFTQPDPWTVISLTEFAEAVATAWEDFISTGTSDHVTLSSVRAISSLVGVEVPAGTSGAVTGDTTPPNTALLVNFNTARRGRRGRGRAFLPGMTFENTTNDDGTLDAAWRDSQQARVDGFFNALADDETAFQVVIQNSEGNSPPIVPPPNVVSRVVDGKVSTQRRRLRR